MNTVMTPVASTGFHTYFAWNYNELGKIIIKHNKFNEQKLGLNSYVKNHINKVE